MPEQFHQAHPSSSLFWKKRPADRTGQADPFIYLPQPLERLDFPLCSQHFVFFHRSFQSLTSLGNNPNELLLRPQLQSVQQLTPIHAFSETAPDPTFQWELADISPSLTHPSQDLLFAETIDAEQPLCAQAVDEAPGSTDLSPSEYPCCSAELISPVSVGAQQRTCLNPLSHVSCSVNQPPLEQVILGSSSVITAGIPIPHRPQPGHIHLL